MSFKTFTSPLQSYIYTYQHTDNKVLLYVANPNAPFPLPSFLSQKNKTNCIQEKTQPNTQHNLHYLLFSFLYTHNSFPPATATLFLFPTAGSLNPNTTNPTTPKIPTPPIPYATSLPAHQ